jgi:putative methyltransferase
MSLYHEAAQVLEKATRDGGSIKLLVFGKKDWKSDPKTLYALTTEAAKWSEILSEAIDHSGFLTNEKQVTVPDRHLSNLSF